MGSRTSPGSYNVYTAMISNILVALSTESSIYQVPPELVRPCERYFTPMEHHFLNTSTGEHERAIVLTYVPERAELRKNTAFIDLYIDIEEYPLYGRAGVARFLPEDPVPPAGSMDTLTPPSNQAPLAQQEPVEVLDEVQDAKAELANIQQGVDYDEEEEEETRRLLFSLVELEDMKLHVATMSANIQKLLPPDIRTLLEDFDRGNDIKSVVNRGIDTNDLVVSQPPPSPAKVYVDKETDAADTKDLVVSQPPPSPPSPAKVYVDKETDAADTKDLVVSQPPPSPPSPAKVYVDKETDAQGPLQPAADIDTNYSLDNIESPASPVPAPATSASASHWDIRGTRPSSSQASAAAPASKSESYWDLKTHSPSVFVPWRPRPPSYYIYRSPTMSPLRSSNASSASLAPIPPLTLSGTSNGTSDGDTLLDSDSDSSSDSVGALVPSLSFECGLPDCRTRHGPLLRAREARWIAESKSQQEPPPPASLTVPLVPPARVEDAPEPVTVAAVAPLEVALDCVVTGCASGQGRSQPGEEKWQEIESVLEITTTTAIASPSPSLVAIVSLDAGGDEDAAAEEGIAEYWETETDGDDGGDLEEEEEDASYGGEHDSDGEEYPNPKVQLHEADSYKDGGVLCASSEGDDEYESVGEEGSEVEDEGEWFAAEGACDVEQVGTEISQLDMEERASSVTEADVEEAGIEIEDEEEGPAADGDSACDVEQVGNENSQLDSDKEERASLVAEADVKEADIEDEEEGPAADGDSACDVEQVGNENSQLDSDKEERASLVTEADVEEASVYTLNLEPEEVKAFTETRPPDIALSDYEDPDPASVQHESESESEVDEPSATFEAATTSIFNENPSDEDHNHSLAAEDTNPEIVNGNPEPGEPSPVSEFGETTIPESEKDPTELPISANEGPAAGMGASSDDLETLGMASLSLEDLLAIYQDIEIATTKAHEHEYEREHEHESYETNSEGRDYSLIFEYVEDTEEEEEEEADSHTAFGDLAQSIDGEADCLAEHDMTTRTEEAAQAQAEDSVHVHVDDPDILEVNNVVTVVSNFGEVAGTKLEEQAEDGVEADDTYNLHSDGSVSNLVEGEPALDFLTSKVDKADDGVVDNEDGGGGSPCGLTNCEYGEGTLDEWERQRRSVIAQGKRREVLYEDEVPSTPKNNRSRPPTSPTSESAEHPTRTKQKLRGVSAIFGFTPTAPELLQRRESLTPVATDANRKQSPSRSLSGFRMPKLKGTGRLLNGAWKPSSGGDDSGSSPRKLKKMKPATLWAETAAALSSPTPAPTVAATASESAHSTRKKVVFPSKLWSSAAAREKLPASEPAPTIESPGKKGAGVWGNAIRALKLPKESMKEPKKGAGTLNDAKVNLALLMPKAVSAQIYSRKR